MPKVDFREIFSDLYQVCERRFELVDVPRMHYLVCCGREQPFQSPRFTGVSSALRRISTGIQSSLRDSGIMDFRTMPLECLWAEKGLPTPPGVRESWQWMQMIMQPVIKHHLFEKEKQSLDDVAALSDCRNVQMLTFREGPSVQTLHQGPAGEESRTRKKLDDYIHSQGWVRRGFAHTIYLTEPAGPSDPVTAILRQPVIREVST
ncbi:MAG TPA: hypothetical protein VM534_02925 [Thermoanaerobaculia bacterium]|nr:hypothetical protein [Thermoanaerobaculia bacterium]